MLGLVGILTLDQNVHVMMVALEADVKLSLTHVKKTLALMEELALVLEDVSHVIVQLDILESLVLFACNHFVPALCVDVKRREIMEYAMQVCTSVGFACTLVHVLVYIQCLYVCTSYYSITGMHIPRPHPLQSNYSLQSASIMCTTTTDQSANMYIYNSHVFI